MSGLVFVLTEVVSQLPAADLLRFLSQLQSMLGDLIAGHVGCHDEDGVLTLDGLSLPVSEAPLNVPSQRRLIARRRRMDSSSPCVFSTHLVEELQHDGEDVRVGLVHLIKQHHSVGTSLQQLRQLTALLVPHIARRRADELGHLRNDEANE